MSVYSADECLGRENFDTESTVGGQFVCIFKDFFGFFETTHVL